MHRRISTQPLPPHPPLPRYYPDPLQRQRFVREIFDETAAWYDGIVAMLSFGSGSRLPARRAASRREVRAVVPHVEAGEEDVHCAAAAWRHHRPPRSDR
jgi:hypothetical protein